MNKDERTQKLLHRFDVAQQYRAPWDDRAVDFYRLYTAYREPLPEGVRRSNLFIPKTYEHISTYRARLLRACVGAKPFIDFVGVGPEDQEKAQMAAAYLDYQAERMGLRSKFYDFLTMLLTFPTAIGAVGWRYEKKERTFWQTIPLLGLRLPRKAEVVVYDDNDFEPVDFFDFWPDPQGADIDSCRFVWQREWLTEQQIEQRLEVLSRAGQGKVYDPDWEEIRAARPTIERGKDRLASSVGFHAAPGQLDESPSEDDLHEVLHYWEDGAHALIVNRLHLIYDGGNPFWHGKKPFVAASFEPIPGQFYGMSAVQLLEDLQHELNTQRNQRIDNVTLCLNRMFTVTNADLTEEDLQSRPNGIIHVMNHDDIRPLEVPDVTASSYQEEAITKRDMEEILGTPAVVRGVTGERKETATEVALKNENAGTRFETTIMLLEERVLKRMAYMMDSNNQQFTTTAKMIRLWEDGAYRHMVVMPDQITGQFDYLPASASVDPAANKTLRRQQLNEVLQIAAGSPIIGQYVNMQNLVRLWLENYDIKNTEEIILKQPIAQVAQASAMPQEVTPEAIRAMLGGVQGAI